MDGLRPGRAIVDESVTFDAPTGLVCEARGHTIADPRPAAAFLYGPECEAETGKLMYLCGWHAEKMRSWMRMHPNRPVDCPTHGRVGVVKDVVVLRRL